MLVMRDIQCTDLGFGLLQYRSLYGMKAITLLGLRMPSQCIQITDHTQELFMAQRHISTHTHTHTHTHTGNVYEV